MKNLYFFKICAVRRLTQHIRFGLTPLLLGTFAYRRTSYMLGTLGENGGFKNTEKDRVITI